MNNPLFFIGLTFMLIHEMDAVRCREWRIFPGLSSLEERLAFRIFIFAHLPIFLALFWALKTPRYQTELIFWMELFFIIHVFLHLAYLKHEKNEFKDWISWIFISVPAVFGIIDLLV